MDSDSDESSPQLARALPHAGPDGVEMKNASKLPLSGFSSVLPSALFSLPSNLIYCLDGHCPETIPPDEFSSSWSRFYRSLTEFGLMMKLAVVLARHTGLFHRWLVMMARLLLFALCLIPAWIRIGHAYFRDSRIIRSVRYGHELRNYLDIFLPVAWENKENQNVLTPFLGGAEKSSHGSTLSPVLVYFTGGAWTIGWKNWGSLLGFSLRSAGYLVVSCDYRNFPQTDIDGMVSDCESALRWIWSNIDQYGGDPKRIFLVGQSAGAHIAALTVLINARREAEGKLGIFRFDCCSAQSGESPEAQQAVQEEENARENSSDFPLPELETRRNSFGAPKTPPKAKTSSRLNSATGSPIFSPSTPGSRRHPHSIIVPHGSPFDSAVPRGRRTSCELPLDSPKSPLKLDSSSPRPDLAAPSPSIFLPPECLAQLESRWNTAHSTKCVETHGFPVSRLRGFIGISGPYDMVSLLPHLISRGMPRGVLYGIMKVSGPETADATLSDWSPQNLAQQPGFSQSVPKLPPIMLVHGTADTTLPHESSLGFGRALEEAGARVALRLLEGGTHTDPIIEDPLKGCDTLGSEIVDFVSHCCASQNPLFENPETVAKTRRIPRGPTVKSGPPLISPWFTKIARFVNPF